MAARPSRMGTSPWICPPLLGCTASMLSSAAALGMLLGAIQKHGRQGGQLALPDRQHAAAITHDRMQSRAAAQLPGRQMRLRIDVAKHTCQDQLLADAIEVLPCRGLVKP